MAGTFDHLMNTSPTKGTFDHLVKGPIRVASKAKIVSPEDSLAMGDITQPEYDEIKKNLANQPVQKVDAQRASTSQSYFDSVARNVDEELAKKEHDDSVLAAEQEKADSTASAGKSKLTRDAMGDWLNMGLLGVAKGMTEGKPVKSAIKDAEWNPYTITKQLLSNIPAAVASGASALGAGVSAPSGAVVDNMLQSAKDTYSDAYTKGTKGEGVEGFVSDPTNLSVLIPGVGAGMKVKSALGGLVKYGLIPAAGSAAITAASDAFNPDRDVTVKDELISAGLGGVGGLVGSGIQKALVRTFPGVQNNLRNLRNRGSSQEEAQAKVDEIVERMLNETSYPGTRSQFVKTGEKYKNQSMKEYDDLIGDIDPEKIDRKAKIEKFENDAKEYKAMYGNEPKPKTSDDASLLKFWEDSPGEKSIDENLISERAFKSKLRRSLLDKNKASSLGMTHKEIEDEVDDLYNRVSQRKYSPKDIKEFEKNKKIEDKIMDEQVRSFQKYQDDITRVDRAISENDKNLAKHFEDFSKGANSEDELTKHLDDYISGNKDLSIDELDGTIDDLGNTQEAGSKLLDLLEKSKRLKQEKIRLDEIYELEQELALSNNPKYAYEVPNYTTKEGNVVEPGLKYTMPKISPDDLQRSKKFINSEVYRKGASPEAAQKRVVAREAIESFNDMISEMNSLGKKDVKKDLDKAAENYRHYKEIDELLEDYGVRSGSSWRLGVDGLAQYFRTGPTLAPRKIGYGLAGRLPLSGALIVSKKDSTDKNQK